MNWVEKGLKRLCSWQVWPVLKRNTQLWFRRHLPKRVGAATELIRDLQAWPTP